MRTTHDVPDGWQVVRLDDIADVIGGSTPSRATSEYWGGAISWAVPSEITRLSGRYLTSTTETITDAGLRSAGLRLLPSYSILLTSRATIGELAINTIPVATNQGFQNVVVKQGTDLLWLYYCLAAMRQALRSRASGSTFREVSRDSIRSLPILLPPLAEQCAIATVLDSIDATIESTDAVLISLQQFRHCVQHELLSRGIPGWHSHWRERSRLGAIPIDWQVAPLYSIAEIGFSSVDKKSTPGETPVRLCNYTDVFYNRRIQSNMDFMTATATSTERSKWRLERGDVVFTKDSETQDEIGVPTYIAEDIPDLLCGYHLAKARPRASRIDGAFLMEVLASDKSRQQFARIANGTTRFGLTLDSVRAFPIPLPSLVEQRKIVAVLFSIDDLIDQTRVEKMAAQILKASASDGLLTGRIRLESSRV